MAIGGDDTLSYAAHLDQQGVKVVAVPKTMDNDVRNTEYCIGFSTAVNARHRRDRAAADHGRRRTSASAFFAFSGAMPGYTALYTAYVNSIRCCIPEFKWISTS